MPRLVIASTAVSSPMGAQVYQSEVAGRAPAELGPDWDVTRTIVRSIRSPLDGTLRLPFNHLDQAPGPVRRAVGRVMYPRNALVHRMDLGLPPARHEVVTVHDVVAWRFPDETQPSRHASAEVRRAAAVVCPSHFSAREAQEFLGVESPHVIHNGADLRFHGAEPLDAAAREALGVPPGPFALHAGGSSLRKNLEGLADAWRIISRKHRDLSLVLIGPNSKRREELFGALDRTHRIGHIAGDLVPGLVAAASVVVVPSVYEGFGLPAVEAMAAGTLVVAANRSSLPEVCGDAAILTEPDGPGLADGVIDALADTTDSEHMIERGRARAREFTWERSSALHAALWRALA